MISKSHAPAKSGIFGRTCKRTLIFVFTGFFISLIVLTGFGLTGLIHHSTSHLSPEKKSKQAIEILPRKFDAKKRANFCSPRFFSFFYGEKSPQILKSRITHMVTSNGGHPLHHHLGHSSRLSNSLFNRRTTKFQTFTRWPQASAL